MAGGAPRRDCAAPSTSLLSSAAVGSQPPLMMASSPAPSSRWSSAGSCRLGGPAAWAAPPLQAEHEREAAVGRLRSTEHTTRTRPAIQLLDRSLSQRQRGREGQEESMLMCPENALRAASSGGRG